MPAAMTAGAAGPVTDLETFQQDGIAPFQHLGVGQAAVRHMRMNRITAIEIGTCARTAAQRLVILIDVVAVDEVVHRTLRRRHHAERAI